MTKAARISAGVIVVLAAGWLGTTWYTGKRIEADAPAKLAQANQALADVLRGTGIGLEIRLLDYQRNFFTSQARYGLAPVQAADAPPVLPQRTLEFVSRIEHGPFPKGALARGKWLPQMAFTHAEMVAHENLIPVFELTSDLMLIWGDDAISDDRERFELPKGFTPPWSDMIISYGGDIWSTAGVEHLKLVQSGNILTLSETRLQSRYTQAAQRATLKIGIGQAAVNDTVILEPDSLKLTVSGVTLDADRHPGQFGFPIGSYRMQAQRLDIENSRTRDTIALQSLDQAADLTESDAGLNLQMRYEIGQIDVNGRSLGQGRATLKLDRLDGQAIAGLNKLYSEILMEIDPDDPDLPALNAQRRQALRQYGTQILAGNPSLRLDPLTWQTAEGSSSLTVALDLTKPAAMDAEPSGLDEPSSLFQQAIKAFDLKVTLSKPMAQDILAQLMQAQGLDAQRAASKAKDQVRAAAGMAEMFNLGKNDGDNVVGAFHYADGAATLNGETIPIDEWFSDLADSLSD